MIKKFDDYFNNKITSFGGLTQDDVDTISDLMLDFLETWDIKDDLKINRPSEYFIKVSFSRETCSSMFQSEEEKEKIRSKKEYYLELEKELIRVMERIRRFGYQMNGGYYKENGRHIYYFDFCKS